MKWNLPSSVRKWLIVPPLLLGAGVIALLWLIREQPEHAPQPEERRVLRTIHVVPVDVVPTVLGYGTAQPGQVWRAIVEVQGRVAEVHPQLKAGSIIPDGELLLQISPEEYELAIARFEADLHQVEAQMDELAVKEANDRASLEIEQASLSLAEGHLQRLQQLLEQNAVAPSDVEQETRTVLIQRQSVQQMLNSLRLIPQQRKSLEATRAVKHAGLSQAQLDLAKTKITAPFALRLAHVNIEPGQFFSAGQTLFEAHGIAVTEIDAQVPIDQLRNLIDRRYDVPLPAAMGVDAVRRVLDFDVTVRYRSGDFSAEWAGRVVRMREQLDPRTRTVGLVVAVDEPYEKVIPGERPPLMQGMYCEVELRGAVRSGQIVIPRSALHDGHVYVLDHDNRLRRREVQVSFAQSGLLILEKGLREGERLIVSDPAPAIEGLWVDPIADDRLQHRLFVEAAAEGSLE